jgi:hypothetical protein
MTLALCEAVFVGMWDVVNNATPGKKAAKKRPRNMLRSLSSLFKRGLCRFRTRLHRPYPCRHSATSGENDGC